MSHGAFVTLDPAPPSQPPRPTLPLDQSRGTQCTYLFIVTEAALFAVLYFAYFHLGNGHLRWSGEPMPDLEMAVIMLVILLASSVSVWGAERLHLRDKGAAARALTLLAAALGVVFLLLQASEYRKFSKVITPASDAYGSIFYTITSVHGLHVVLGVLMLLYVSVLGRPKQTAEPPHRGLHNVGLYWHFVDVVWLTIVLILYAGPRVGS